MAIQARMQLQQEQELRHIATMAVVRREAAKITSGIAQRAKSERGPYER